jgi:nitroreductase
MNNQAWKFVAIRCPKVMEQLKEICQKALGNDPYYNAPAVAFVFVSKEAVTPVLDGAAALENIMVAAASLGIGSCWVHSSSALFATEEGKAFQRELGVDSTFTCIDGCCLGYPSGEWPAPQPRAEGTKIIL